MIIYLLSTITKKSALERRFGKYRQMIGGRFLVGLQVTIRSEKILKIKCFLKKDIEIDEEIKISCPREMKITKLKTPILLEFHWTLMLSPDSRKVVVHIAGCTAKKYLKKIKSS